jgi:hypothetical protein
MAADFRFMTSIETNRYSGEITRTFYAEFVHVLPIEDRDHDRPDSGIRNGLHYDHGPVGALADLTITAQMDPTFFGEQWYAWSVVYLRPFAVDLRRCERMVKVLRRIDKTLKRFDDQFGQPTDLAAYCGRVAQAIGCTSPTPFGERISSSSASTYNGNTYRWHDIDNLRILLAQPERPNHGNPKACAPAH